MSREIEQVYQVMRSFREVNRTLHHLLRETADELDTTVVQIMVLKTLGQSPNIGLNELADHLQLGNSTMSGVVERLVSAGLIVRERSSKDRRSLTMRLTEKGEEIKQQAFGEDSSLVNNLANLLDIPQEDLDHLLQTHEKIIEKLAGKGEEEEL
ncbi:MAG TPA: MarR family transcriptional regulator [Bacillales bacterium]|nr:MarR family transcriptional regulator [Bacillales bacterium]